MKPVMLLTIAIATTLFSCKRVYTCRCEGGMLRYPIEQPMEKMTKKDAKAKCDTKPSSTAETFCHLK